MQTRVSIISVRRSAVAKCFAACLVALVVSPVTAPFPTISLDEISGDMPFHTGCGATKLVRGGVDLSGLAATTPQLTAPLLHQVIGSFDRLDGRPVHPLVVRVSVHPLVLRI